MRTRSPAASRLKFIAVAATGTDNVDLAACRERGIVVSNIRNYAVHTVPEHTFALIFALRRSICAYRDAVRAGRWQASGQFCFFDFPIRDLAGSTLGVIGDGVLGQAVAAIGRALGMRVLMSAFKGRADMGTLYTPFDRVLAESDIITLHCPLLPQTRHMIGGCGIRSHGPCATAGEHRTRRARGRICRGPGIGFRSDLGRRLRRRRRRTASAWPPVHGAAGSPRLHPDSPCGLGQRRSHSSPGRPAGRTTSRRLCAVSRGTWSVCENLEAAPLRCAASLVGRHLSA